ncbi:MAG: glycerol-3-phosphate dehydrogenase/oxidase [Bacteroidota bacterium]
MNLLGSANRGALVEKIKEDQYDLLVIGGGVTGAGIALDAATRGLRTLLVEKNDFASGTSSKSTKLIHGGLRYLKQFEIQLVREVGRERAVVHGLAPHLVINEKMILPLITDGTYGKMLTSIGLMVYDVLAGVEKEDQRKMLTKEETLELEPLIREDLLEGGGIYAEYRTDDARLTMEILKTAKQYGADIINYAEAVDFVYTDGKITGVKWLDRLGHREHELSAKYTISAAGPWVDELRAKNQSLKGKFLHPTKGVHIVVPRERFPVNHAIYFDVPDGRMIFAVPRDRVTYIGTTDTDYHGDLDDVRTDLADVEYLIEGVNHIFPKVGLQVSDVESTWAGLRPLIEEEGKSASELSRKDEIFESDTGLLSIAGGKLTGYRKMAERIVNRIGEKMKEEYDRDLKPCQTENTILVGGVFSSQKDVRRYTQSIEEKLERLDPSLKSKAEYLVSNYGRQTGEILAQYKSVQGSAEERLALCELEFTLENESVFTLLDFFERRTGRLYFDIPSIEKVRDAVCQRMKAFFSWSDEELQQNVDYLDRAIRLASHFE